MKLRNKKTGEVFDALIREKGGGGSYSLIVCDIKAYEQSKSTPEGTHFILDEYDSLAELNSEWEDCAPTEPLIKDEKIRKAVRAWAEANRVIEARYWSVHDAECEFTARDDENKAVVFIGNFVEMNERLGIDGVKIYTIAELCGEEEE